MRLALAPGNVALRKKEAGLRQASVVNVSQLITVDKSMLQEELASSLKSGEEQYSTVFS